MQHLEIKQHKDRGIVVLGVIGRLDALNAGTFEQAIIDRINAGERRFVVDCAGLDYVSSGGLRVLLLAAKRLASLAGTIVLSAPKAQIKQVFDIVGFESVFKIYPTSKDAISAFARSER
jgi:anti-sigma B factor antagonist